jgi:hypothetical protein
MHPDNLPLGDLYMANATEYHDFNVTWSNITFSFFMLLWLALPQRSWQSHDMLRQSAWQ